MRPRDTIYRLAHGQRDLRACQAIARARGITDATMGWPTVVADRQGQLLGFLATTPSKKVVQAGPMVIAPGVALPALIMMRLIEAYEVVLKRAGVTQWFFRVEYTNQGWDRMVKKCGHVAYHQDALGTIYRREVA
jgi:hypothetical protein